MAKRSAAEKWYSATSARAKRTVWSQARSYMRANGGTGDVFTHYPGFVGEIWWTNREPEWADYEGADPAARRQVLRRTVQRVVLATALVATLRYGVPASWYDQAHTAALDAAQAVGAPTSIVSAAASALSSAAGLVDSARDYVAGLLKW